MSGAGSGEPVGFLGLGNMGLAMVQRLTECGIPVVAFDPVSQRLQLAVAAGAAAAASAQEVASQTSIVCASLPTPHAAEGAFFGPAGAAEGNRMRHAVDLSTIGPAAVARHATGLRDRDVAYVEAPVSGGPNLARSGQLSIMLAGSETDIAVVGAVLEALSARRRVVGSVPGCAQGMKLVNNLVGLSQLVLVAEGLVLAGKFGIDPAIATEVLNAGVARSHVSEAWVPKHVLTGSFDYGFSAALALKDVQLAVDQVAGLGLDLPMARASLTAWSQFVAHAGGSADITACVRSFERTAGIEPRRQGAG